MRNLAITSSVLLFLSTIVITSCGCNDMSNTKPTPFDRSFNDSAKTKATLGTTKMDKEINQANEQTVTDAGLKTIENMKAAYRGEMTATAKYAAYSKKAEEDGFHPIAILYKAVSIAESIHAKNHKEVLLVASEIVPIVIPTFVVKSTKENLHDDIDGEANEANTMYPAYLKIADEANNQLAYTSLLFAMKTERKHKVFFEKALGDINSNTLKTMPSVYFVCPVCGNTYEASTPKRCDFSLTPKDKFIKINSL